MAVKVTNLSKRGLERRLQKLTDAFQKQRQGIVEKRNLAVLLAAKLYNLKSDDEVFASFTTEYKKVVVDLANGLKSGEYKVEGNDGNSRNEPPAQVHDIMGLENPIKGYYSVIVGNRDVTCNVKIADRRPAGEFLDDKTVLKMMVFHKIITEEGMSSVKNIKYETTTIVSG